MPDNLDPLFVLSTGHAFSSVVSTMMGKHPETYGVPELNLFLGDTLEECVKAFQITGRLPLAGLKRSLAELHEGEQTVDTVDRATQWIEKNGHYTARMVMDHLQECVGPRIIVEKSPSTAFKSEQIVRMARQFPASPFVHLLRHPRTFGQSRTVELKTRPTGRMLQWLKGTDPAEQWRVMNLRILAFGRSLASGQMLRIRGEDLLREPRVYLPQFCEWLGVSTAPEAIEEMMHPENSPYSSVGPENAKGGTSAKFLESPALDEERLKRMSHPSMEGPVEWRGGENFPPDVRELAGWLGYA